MAKKDVLRYYSDVEEEYFEMIDNLKSLEEYATTHVVSPERIEKYKQEIEPLKVNYLRLSWVVYLLNKPSKFQERIEKLLAKINIKTKERKLAEKLEKEHSPEKIKEENQEVLNRLNKMMSENIK